MKQQVKYRDVLSGSLLISGTIVGAGMLGIPLVTGASGFLPASVITTLVWVFMLLTGFLFLEATLWMHRGANIISMSRRFLGHKGKLLAGGTFIFLYYCLMVAYFAAGGPLLISFVNAIFNISISGWLTYAIFGLVFGSIVGVGIKFVDRVNYILMIALVVSYVALVSGAGKAVEIKRLIFQDWSASLLAAPILFTSFGFHNLIPSLTTHFKQNAKVMRAAIFFGTLIPFLIYLIWQWLIIGAVPKEVVLDTLEKGQPITIALQSLTGRGWVHAMANIFGLFAIITSMLGVSFSVVDFLGDGLDMKRHGKDRFLLCLLTFIPPFILSTLDPSIFVLAISVAGGFGEAFLNGILPAWLVWVGRYKRKLKSDYQLFGGKLTLNILFLISFFVILLEVIFIIKH